MSVTCVNCVHQFISRVVAFFWGNFLRFCITFFHSILSNDGTTISSGARRLELMILKFSSVALLVTGDVIRLG
jgi:hypothetical protein